jgi:L-asparagine transporter-like permease
MEELKSTGIALVTVLLSISIRFITLAMVQPEEMKKNIQQVYAVGFDLIMISLSILLSLYFSYRAAADQHKRARLFTPMLGVFIATLLSLLLLALTLAGIDWVDAHRLMVTIWIPNVIGLVSIALSIRAALK